MTTISSASGARLRSSASSSSKSASGSRRSRITAEMAGPVGRRPVQRRGGRAGVVDPGLVELEDVADVGSGRRGRPRRPGRGSAVSGRRPCPSPHLTSARRSSSGRSGRGAGPAGPAGRTACSRRRRPPRERVRATIGSVSARIPVIRTVRASGCDVRTARKTAWPSPLGQLHVDQDRPVARLAEPARPPRARRGRCRPGTRGRGAGRRGWRRGRGRRRRPGPAGSRRPGRSGSSRSPISTGLCMTRQAPAERASAAVSAPA